MATTSKRRTASRTRSRRSTRLERERARRVLDAQIEFIPNRAFRAAHAADTFLSVPPVADAVSPVADAPARPAGPSASLPPYLADLYQFPLLTPAEERQLFLKMNYLKYCADALRRQIDAAHPQTGLLDQIEALLSDALAVRNSIVQSNLRLVVAIAKKLIDPVNRFEDLVSDGHQPLIRAVELFDAQRGLRFSTYATWAVRNALYRSVKRSRERTVRVQLAGRSPSESAKPVKNALGRGESAHDVESDVARALEKLPPRERMIVAARFGLAAFSRPRKLHEIAESVDLSTERVRQLLDRSLERLRREGHLDRTWERSSDTAA